MANRRARGEGDVHRRADGRWEARLDLGWRDGKRVRKSYFGRTKDEAARKLREGQGLVDRGLPPGD
jgi:integrase